MLVLACYAGNVDSESLSCLTVNAPEALRIYVGTTATDYWNEIALRWNGTQDLVIVEQDNDLPDDALSSFAACPEPWCLYWYHGPAGVRLDRALGCTRFSAELQCAVPISDISASPVIYDMIDTTIAEHLTDAGYVPHVHGECRHHHKYEIIYLDPPGPLRRYTWRHVGRTHPGTRAKADGRKPHPIPKNAERVIIDTADLFGKEAQAQAV